jgi:hypothetical protein
LVEAIGRDYDVVFLDCPAGFSLVIEGIFSAADAILAPTVPTVLSLRTLIRLMKWAERSESAAELAAFLSMVDRRKALHRRTHQLSRDHPEVFLAGLVPYASIVEQMSVRRLPLAAFAPLDGATVAFAEIWTEFAVRLNTLQEGSARDRWGCRRRAVESVLAQLESSDAEETVRGRVFCDGHSSTPVASTYIVHRFDTDACDLEQRRQTLELHEREGSWLLVVNGEQTQIDRAWARDILSGVLSPLAALEQRVGRAGSPHIDGIRALVGRRHLQRIESLLRETEHTSIHSVNGYLAPAGDSVRVEAT